MNGVAIIGAGAAGLSAALVAASSATRVTVLTDRSMGRANSTLAQGGLQVALSPESEAGMIDDMVRSAADTSVRGRVEHFVRNTSEMFAWLQSIGLVLDTDETGALRKRIAGGMSEPRVVTSGDRIGAPVMRLLGRLVRESANIEVLENCQVQDLSRGANGLELHTEQGTAAFGSVVCATGGTAWSEAQRLGLPTSNPPNDNHVLHDRLNAMLGPAPVSPFQFQPFGHVASLDDRHVGKLIPESIVGFDVRILDRMGAPVVDPRAGRLRVTEAMREAHRSGRSIPTERGVPGYRLTLSDVSTSHLKRLYPNLTRRLDSMDLLGSDVVIAPFIHYQLGGYAVQTDGSTEVPGLFLAGEVTGGLHGRNRLMGNGLTESLVCGRMAGAAAAEFAA